MLISSNCYSRTTSPHSPGVSYTASPYICLAFVSGLLVICKMKRTESESMNLRGITASIDVSLFLRVSWDKRELVGTIQFNFLLIWQHWMQKLNSLCFPPWSVFLPGLSCLWQCDVSLFSTNQRLPSSPGRRQPIGTLFVAGRLEETSVTIQELHQW